ncbi:hypothetical protein [Pelolinea submarina]|uniref:Uncharacterized protein n=1 Tax=Pelolinea submarina TaxID=913107 RepID=A0A3E0A564_9CHLR|nr:hypothetical protein [Pelolinea submarina]REG05454.1 hypothetical protein DFR64_2855 [Pelolinea submarina]
MLKQISPTSQAHAKATSTEYSRILSAAVINSKFREMLLNDPIKAVTCGYSGEIFDLDREDKNRLATIRATSLADFAAQLSEI